MTKALRHRCRNLRCRMKLPAPVENEHQAFCARGCFDSFYFNRCRVCEQDLRHKGKRGQRLYCRPPNKCAAEAQKWPDKYAPPKEAGPEVCEVRPKLPCPPETSDGRQASPRRLTSR
jgi:hypothetical protein